MPVIKKLQENLITSRNSSIVPNSNPKYKRDVENLPLSFISTKNRHEKFCSVLLSSFFVKVGYTKTCDETNEL